MPPIIASEACYVVFVRLVSRNEDGKNLKIHSFPSDKIIKSMGKWVILLLSSRNVAKCS